jgi:hypothetical protein
MSTRLISIVWVGARKYEVSIDVEGVEQRCTCRVAERDGVRFIEADPDFLPELGVSSRLIAAAVLAVDAANGTTMDPGS